MYVVFPARNVTFLAFRDIYVHTVASRIEREDSAFPFAHVRHLLCETRETQTRIPCTVMTNHDCPVRKPWRGVVDAHVKLGCR